MKTNIIGIDQSFTCTGIVIVSNERNMLHFSTIKTSKEFDIIQRMRIITNRIQTLCGDYDVKTMNIEGLSFGSMGQATRNLAMLYGAIVVPMYDRLKTINTIAPTSLKKRATGNGKASKQDMLAMVPDIVVEQFMVDHKKTTGLYDLADAYHLAMLK